jgi:creatine kinase
MLGVGMSFVTAFVAFPFMSKSISDMEFQDATLKRQERMMETLMKQQEASSATLAKLEQAIADLESPHREDLQRIDKIKQDFPDNLAIKHFSREYFNSLNEKDKKALLKIIRSGIENEDSGMGCYAMHPDDYDYFKPFFKKVLADYHGVSEDAQHTSSWSLEGVEGLPADGKLDLEKLGLPALSMRVRTGRNMAAYPLPGNMSKYDRVTMEDKLTKAFRKLQAMPEYGGNYYSLTAGHPNHISDEKYQELVKAHIMFKDMSHDPYLATAGIASDWPTGRGCYVSADRGFIIWVGEEDHLRIMCMHKGTVLNDVFDRLHTAIGVVSSIPGLDFAQSPDYGVVTSCPTNLGTAMRASVHIGLPKLCADGTERKAKEVCKPLGLSVRGSGGEHTAIGPGGICDISPRARFCISEAQIVTALYTGIALLKEAEDNA